MLKIKTVQDKETNERVNKVGNQFNNYKTHRVYITRSTGD